jgi:hypothetical protein
MLKDLWWKINHSSERGAAMLARRLECALDTRHGLDGKHCFKLSINPAILYSYSQDRVQPSVVLDLLTLFKKGDRMKEEDISIIVSAVDDLVGTDLGVGLLSPHAFVRDYWRSK